MGLVTLSPFVTAMVLKQPCLHPPQTAQHPLQALNSIQVAAFESHPRVARHSPVVVSKRSRIVRDAPQVQELLHTRTSRNIPAEQVPHKTLQTARKRDAQTEPSLPLLSWPLHPTERIQGCWAFNLNT